MCAAVDEPTFSNNKCFHWKFPPQFSMMSINLFLLQVSRAAHRVSNTQNDSHTETCERQQSGFVLPICECDTAVTPDLHLR